VSTHITLDDGTQLWRDIPPTSDGIWWTDGHFHRDDGPAIIMPDGTEAWFCHGKLHRADGPAITRPDGTQLWYVDGHQVVPEEVTT